MQIWLISPDALYLLHNGKINKLDECSDVDCVAVNTNNNVTYALDVKAQTLYEIKTVFFQPHVSQRILLNLPKKVCKIVLFYTLHMRTMLGLIDEECNLWEVPMNLYDLLDYNPSRMDRNEVKRFQKAHVIKQVFFRDFIWYVISFNPHKKISSLLLYDLDLTLLRRSKVYDSEVRDAVLKGRYIFLCLDAKILQFNIITECITHAQEFEENVTAFTLAHEHQLLAFNNTLVIEEINEINERTIETHIAPYSIIALYVIETDYRNVTSKVNQCPVTNVPQKYLDLYLSVEQRQYVLEGSPFDHNMLRASANDLATDAIFKAIEYSDCPNSTDNESYDLMLEFYKNNSDYLLQGKTFGCPESSILPWKTLVTLTSDLKRAFPEKRMVYQICESRGLSFFAYQHPITKEIIVAPNYSQIIKVFNVPRNSKFMYTIITSKDASYKGCNLFEPLMDEIVMKC